MKLRFTPGSYHRYTEESLATQLSSLLTSAFKARAEMRRRALAQAIEADVELRKEHELNAKETEFRRLRAEVDVVGSSPDRAIRIKRSGPDSWKVRLTSGTLSKLDEPEFLAAVSKAVADAIRKYNAELAQIRDSVYGIEGHARYRKER